jgi:hypothetical protein
MKTAVLGTSIDAYRQMPLRKLGAQQQRICEVIEDAMRAGHADMSLREIAAAYAVKFGVRLDVSPVSGRVNELVGWRLERLQSTRPCAVTGKSVHPVRIPPVIQGTLWQ